MMGVYSLLHKVGVLTGANTMKMSRCGWKMRVQRLLSAAAALAASVALADNGTWTSAVSGPWSNTNSWTGGAVADGSGFTADFNQADVTNDLTVHLDTARTLGNLTFGDTATNTPAGWLLDNNSVAGNILTLAGTTPTITAHVLGGSKLVTISATLAGTNGVAKAGTGTLALSGANTFSGGLTLSAGRLYINNGAPTGSGDVAIANNGMGTGGVKLNSGGPFYLKNDGDGSTNAQVLTYGNNVDLGATTTIDVNRVGATAQNKTLALGTLSIGANRTLNVSGASGYVLSFSNVSVTGGATLTPGTAPLSVGSVAIASSVATGTTTTLTLSGASALNVVREAIADNAANPTKKLAVSKLGAGTWRLAGTNTYSGSTTVSVGTLALGSGASISASPILNIAGGATLDVSAVPGFVVGASQTLKGTGTAKGNFTISGALTPGGGVGILTVAGNLTLAGTNSFELNLVTDFDRAIGITNLTYGGTLSVLYAGTNTLAAGRYDLFDFTGSYSGTFSSISLPAAPAGTQWHEFGGVNFDYASGAIQLDDTNATAPVVASPAATLVGTTNATLGATIVTNGGSAVTSWGTTWSTSATGSNDNPRVQAGVADGAFSHLRTGLAAGTHCYSWAWASNSVGLGFTPTYAEFYTEPDSATNLAFSGVQSTQMTLSWTANSSAIGSLVVMRQGAAVSVDPSDAVLYAANSLFAGGQDLGDGNWVVYSGAGTNVTVTGLTPGLTYFMKVCTYAGADALINYQQDGTVESMAAPGDGVWTNTAAGGLWSEGANWSGGLVADGSGSADFSSINVTTDVSVHMDSSRTVSALLFGDTATNTAAGWTIDNNGAATNVLTLGGTPVVTANALGAGRTATVSANLASSAATVHFNGAGGVCVLSASNANFTSLVDIRGSAAGTGLRLANNNAIGPANSGQLNLVGNGSSNYGSLQLTGGISVQEGLYMYGRPTSGVDPHVVNVSGTNTLRGALTFQRAAYRDDYYFRTDSGALTIDTTGWARLNDVHRTIHLQGAGTGVWKSSIGNLGTRSLSITKENAGKWVFQGTNTYGTLAGEQSITRVAAGTLVLDRAAALSTNTALFIYGGVLGMTTNYPSFTLPLGTTNSQVRFAGNAGFAAYGGTLTVNIDNGGAPLQWNGTTNWMTTNQLVFATTDGDGTLDFQNAMDFNGALRTVNVRNGGAAVDAMLSGVLSESAGTDGGLIKIGTGALALTATNTYGGATVISAGRLSLATGGEIALSSNIDVQTGAFLDLPAAGLTLGAAQTIKGNGTVAGSLVVNGTLTPGASIGTLTVTGDVSLAGASLFEVSSPTNRDRLVAGGKVTYGGTLNVTTTNRWLTAMGSYGLFSCASGEGTFASVTLPSLLPGLQWHDFGGGALFDYATGAVQLEVGTPALATLADPVATAIGTTNATLGATIAFGGGAAVTAFGTSWDGTAAGSNSNMQVSSGTTNAAGVFSYVRTDLSPATHYYVWGWASNSVGDGFTPTSAEFYTEALAASNLAFTAVSNHELTVSWDNGNGPGRVVVMRAGAAPSAGPADGSRYAGNAFFGAGDALGGGFVIYEGSGSGVTVSGLMRGVTYYVAVYEYAGTDVLINYGQAGALSGSQATLSLSRTFVYDGADLVDMQWVVPTNYIGDADYPRLAGDRLHVTNAVAANGYALNGNQTAGEFLKVGAGNRNTQIVPGTNLGSVLTWDTGIAGQAASFSVRGANAITAELRCCTTVDMRLNSDLVWDGSTQRGGAADNACISGNISGPGKLTLKWHRTQSDLFGGAPMNLVVSGGTGPNTHAGGTEYQKNDLDSRAGFRLAKQHATGTGDTVVGPRAEIYVSNIAINGGVLYDNSDLYLQTDGTNYARVELDADVSEIVDELYLYDPGTAQFDRQPSGTYGSSLSPALFKNDVWFGGTGVLRVRNGSLPGLLLIVK
jgi:fibronectin-binding autotransporter adhesin